MTKEEASADVLHYKVCELRKAILVKPAWESATNADLHRALELMEEISNWMLKHPSISPPV